MYDSIAINNPDEIISDLRENYNSATNNNEKCLVLIHGAVAYKEKLDYPNSLILLNKLENELKTVDDPFFKSILYSRMAALFSGQVHYLKAKDLIKEALNKSDIVKNRDDKYYAKAFAYYNLVMIEHAERKFPDAVKSIQLCNENFDRISPQSQQIHLRFLIYTYVNFGDTYMIIGEFSRAEKLLLDGISKSKGKFPDLEIYCYMNLMDTNLSLKKNDKAISYAKIALNKINNDEYLLERNIIYDGMIECYKNANDTEMVKKYKKIRDENRKKILLKENNIRRIPKHYYIIGISICLFIFITFYYNRKINLSHIKEKTINLDENKSLTIPVDLENQLLEKLKKFEQSDKFTNSKMSIAILAGIIDTNVQYLSLLINKNKGKNFNSYINHLRIKYIIKELESNKALKTYKISYLANMAGFISHSTFSKIFKQEIGILPSEYIKNMKNH